MAKMQNIDRSYDSKKTMTQAARFFLSHDSKYSFISKMATSGQKRNHHRYAVGKIDRTAAAIRQSRMPTIAFC